MAIPIVQAIALASTVMAYIKTFGLDEKEARSIWTQKYVNSIANSEPGYNVLLIYTEHKVALEGVLYEGKVPYTFFPGLNMYYTLYVFKSGTVDLIGDGGFLNWCFSGTFTRNGSHIVFHNRD